MKHKSIYIIIICIVVCLSCDKRELTYNDGYQLFTDILGREVIIPDTIKRIIALNESTMRLVSYLGATNLVCGIEDVEVRGVAFTHIFANPEIKNQPIIGPMMNADAELIMLQHPDIIIVSNLGVADANELQKKLNTPVVVTTYGDMSNKRKDFYAGLKLVGRLLNKESRADSLINYIQTEIMELNQRTMNQPAPTVYLGGISYRGRHDILSTDPHYAPFEMTNVPNIAIQIDSARIPNIGNTTIDLETLLKWNPEVIFIDQGGYRLVKNNFDSFNALSKLLDCYKNKQVYLIWPYYMYHSNFEVMLINAWNVGKVIYPEQLEDIDIRDKIDEIVIQFVGKPITDKLIEQWGWFRNVTDEF